MYQRQGKAAFKKDLNNIRDLCHAIGNPQNKLRCVHVAGTNGKGSTVHILSAILQKAGYQVGVYTSPHYADFRERIKINTQYIPTSFVTQFVQENTQHIQKIQPSFFEITVAMAFQYFASQHIDIALIETGLGGRLDSTNIILPILSIITNIGMDHMDMLGDSIEAIAAEKAGIIKSKTPVLIGQDQPETSAVFRQHCMAKNAPLYYADKWVHIQSTTRSASFSELGIDFLFGPLKGKWTTESDLIAEYQIQNIQTSIVALSLLQQNGFNISKLNVSDGLASVKKTAGMIGRWDVRQVDPLVIFDSAHNEDGIYQLVTQLTNYTYDQIHFVYGTVDDKKLERILEQLLKMPNITCAKLIYLEEKK